jgi:two-component system chemotaxis sensor kinase CheA
MGGADVDELRAEAFSGAGSVVGGEGMGARGVVNGAADRGVGPGEKDVDDLVEGEIDEFGESEFGADPDMLADFLNNADELVESLDEQILRLEQTPDSPDVIEEIFRAAHTLKGASGMFAFKAIERVMHRMENFFDQVRKGKAKASGEITDIILKAMDMIKTLLQGVRAGKPTGIKTGPMVTMLNGVCAGKMLKGLGDGKIERPEKVSAESVNSTEGGGQEGHGKPQGGGGTHKKSAEQSTIRVDLQRLDALVNLVGELVIDRTRFSSIEEQIRTKGLSNGLSSNMTETVQLFGRHMNEVQDIIMKIRMVPVGNAFNKISSYCS